MTHNLTILKHTNNNTLLTDTELQYVAYNRLVTINYITKRTLHTLKLLTIHYSQKTTYNTLHTVKSYLQFLFWERGLKKQR